MIEARVRGKAIPTKDGWGWTMKVTFEKDKVIADLPGTGMEMVEIPDSLNLNSEGSFPTRAIAVRDLAKHAANVQEIIKETVSGRIRDLTGRSESSGGEGAV